MLYMISLVGAQAAPNVLPLAHFNPDRLVLVYTKTTQQVAENTQKFLGSDVPELAVELFCLANAYHLDEIYDRLETYLNANICPGDQVIVNLTGGTKVMALAAFELAKRTSSRAFYYQSEENKSETHNYHFAGGSLVVAQSTPINPDLSLDQYLRLYLGGYTLEPRAPAHVFENLVLDALESLGPGFEVFERVCPQKESVNEVDCVIRHGTVIAVVEIKTTADKTTVEELNNITAEYLGAYIKKIIVHANSLGSGTQELVKAHKMISIHLPSYNQTQRNTLLGDDRDHLCQTIQAVMAPKKEF